MSRQMPQIWPDNSSKRMNSCLKCRQPRTNALIYSVNCFLASSVYLCIGTVLSSFESKRKSSTQENLHVHLQLHRNAFVGLRCSLLLIQIRQCLSELPTTQPIEQCLRWFRLSKFIQCMDIHDDVVGSWICVLCAGVQARTTLIVLTKTSLLVFTLLS